MASATPAETIDPDAYYRVDARHGFTFGGIGFGTISPTEIRGALLEQLLAAPEAEAVAGYTRLDA